MNRRGLPGLGALLCLALLACGRVGFGERPLRDAGSARPDTGTPAADGGAPIDAGSDAGFDAGGDGEDAGKDSGCADDETLDYCDELPRLRSAPTIDGVLDCGPALRDIPATGWTGTTAEPAARARMAAAWRPDGIYFYVEVDDANVRAAPAGMESWCGDGIELYVDQDGMFPDQPNYETTGVIQLIARAPAASSSRGTGDRYRYGTGTSRAGGWTSPSHVAVLRTGGYALEAFVTAPDLDLSGALMLASGAMVGLNVGINVAITPPAPGGHDPDCPIREGQFFLKILDGNCSGETCLPFVNVGAFCKSQLRP